MKTWFKDNLKFILTIFFLILVTYGNSLNNAFVSDDIAEIAQNPNVGDLFSIVTRPFSFIRLIFYWLSLNLGGLNPASFRIFNYIFHFGSAVLIFALLSRIYTRKLGFIAALIFAVHPAISEAVVWISGGTYPQYTFFFLLSFLFYLLSADKKRYYWFSIISYWFSLMSHPQMSLPLFLLFPLYELGFGNFKKNLLKALPYLLLSVIYVAITLSALPERTNTLQSIHYQESGFENPFVQIPIALSSYFELIFFPRILTLYHSELAFGPIQFAIRVILTLIFFIALIWSFLKNKKIFFWLSLFILVLSPTLTPFRLTWVVAERYNYLAILGIIVPFIIFLDYLTKKIKVKNLDISIIILILIVLSFRTIFRNIDWKNEDNLWIATGQTSPSSPNTHNNLGDVYGRWGDKQRSLQEFQTAIMLKPNYADAYHNSGNVYRELNQMDKALESYQSALKYNPNLWQSHQNIAAIYFQANQFDKSLEHIQQAIQINPKNSNLVLNLGIVYLYSNNKEKAKEVFQAVLNVDPQNQLAIQGLAEASK